MKSRRLVNPGKRRLSLKQKLHFGSKRQRAAAQQALKGRRHSNPKKRRSEGMNRKVRKSKSTAQANYHKKRHIARINKKYANVGEIITIRPLSNTGTRKRRTKKGSNSNTMARRRARRRRTSNPGTHRRRRRVVAAAPRRRRRAFAVGHRRRRRNPGMTRTRTVVRYRNRGVARRRHTRRRSNPGIGGTGDFGRAISIIGGAFVTNFVTKMLPASLNSGILGYVSTAIVAVFQGKMIGKLLKKPQLGKDMTTGGFVYLAIKVANDFMPSLGLPFGLSGMGIIGGSSFYTPQVPIGSNMGSFVAPAGLLAAMPAPAAMRGIGTTRRVGRVG